MAPPGNVEWKLISCKVKFMYYTHILPYDGKFDFIKNDIDLNSLSNS